VEGIRNCMLVHSTDVVAPLLYASLGLSAAHSPAKAPMGLAPKAAVCQEYQLIQDIIMYSRGRARNAWWLCLQSSAAIFQPT
jgi:hypothetical protein